MPTLSYREYLDLLSGPSRKKKLFKTVSLSIFIAAFLLIGVISSLIFYYKKSIEPQLLAANYIQNASVGLISSRQALNDVLETFQVAGEKVSTINNLQDSPNVQEGYFVDLADKQKLLAKIQLAKQNIEFQNNQLHKIATPLSLKNVSNDLQNYYSQSETLLNQTEKNHKFFKDVLLALGPDFYLPVLSNDSVWKTQDVQQVLSYYEDKKLKAQTALTSMAKISKQNDFKSYYDDEIAYLELLVNVSTDITNTLTSQQEISPEDAQPLERAYQQLTNAKTKNAEISAKLLSEKESLLNLNENLNKFAAVRFQSNALEQTLKEENAAYQNKNWLIQKIMQTLQNSFTTA